MLRVSRLLLHPCMRLSVLSSHPLWWLARRLQPLPPSLQPGTQVLLSNEVLEHIGRGKLSCVALHSEYWNLHVNPKDLFCLVLACQVNLCPHVLQWLDVCATQAMVHQRLCDLLGDVVTSLQQICNNTYTTHPPQFFMVSGAHGPKD